MICCSFCHVIPKIILKALTKHLINNNTQLQLLICIASSKNWDLERIFTLSRGGNFVFASLLKKRSTLKGKNLLPVGANSFLLEWTSFSEGFWYAERQTGSTSVISLVKMAENLPAYPVLLRWIDASQKQSSLSQRILATFPKEYNSSRREFASLVNTIPKRLLYKGRQRAVSF